MEVFWGCARHRTELSRSTAQRITGCLNLITDTFRTSNIVRHFFMAICSRPMEAGFALRQMANAGVLAKYIPEFGDIQGIIRYADFHHFPVDEHTLRAIEALAALREAPGPVAACLHNALEHMSDPHILVMATLCHDLGKSEGETHVEGGVRLTELLCRRIGMSEEDTELIAFLVQNHMVMTHISQYRDLDDLDMVREFARTIRTENRLRALFLLTYADLAAVGPNVWNDWKGALLMKLYLRTEMILLGRSETEEDDFWKSEKVNEVKRLVPGPLAEKVEDHVRGLGYRYLVAFTPRHIAMHLECVEQARQDGLALHCTVHQETGMSEVTVSTQDRLGLFSLLAGGFASQLVDINGAALFTRPDGFVVDCFVVCDATQRRPLTDRQSASIERVLRSVILEGRDIQEFVDESRRRLFALLQPRIPVPTLIEFDNDTSRSHTVVDIETGDRTGLLYDITRAMAGLGLDIANARITTDARRVRDAFYVSLGMMKIVDE
jgi:[protein-PII] uridylyltransferase